MKRATSPYHLFAAAATTDANIAITFSNMPHRGRGRGSAGRPYSGGRDQFVTGDAHFRSVRDVNSGGIWRGESGSSGNLVRHCHPQFRHPPPPPFNQAHQVRPRLNEAHQVRPRFNQAHQVRPRINQAHQVRSRPPDFRDWEYAVTLPPADCERFIVLSYNILADYLAIDHWAKLYRHIPGHMLDWQWRKRNIVFELGLWSADILCLQEVDRFHDLLEELKLHGYDGIWKMRTGNPIDGCAIFWRTSRFNLRYEECIEFNKLGLRDNVAQICVLELKNQKGSLQSSLTDSNKVVICNIHVLYNPNRGEIKLGQVRVLLDRAKALSKIWNDAPVVICGDFNCTPKSPLYNFISEQKLNLSGIDRNKVSGQAAAVIRPPRLHGPDSSERSACGSAQVTSVVDGKEVNIEQNTCLSDVQKLDNLDNKAENHYNDTSLDMSAMSLTDVPGENRSALCDAAKVTQQTAVDNSKIIDDADSTKGESPASCSEESGSEKSDLDIPEENKHTEFDSYPTSLGEENQSFGAKIDPESTELLSVEMSSTKPSCQMSDSDSLGTPLPKYNESPSVEMSSTKPSSQMSGSNSIKIPLSTNKEIPSFDRIADDQMSSLLTPSQVDKSYQSTNIDFTLDEKLEKLSVDEIDKDIIFSENVDEDDDASRSALHNAEGFQPSMGTDLEKSDLSGELESASENLLLHAQSDAVEGDLPASLTSKSFDVERTTYNPSLWTPTEIETATGNSSCTFLEHSLPLRSTYTEVMDCSGTRDSSGEPLVTSYNRCFLGTVDYIWRSDGLQTIRVLAPIPKHAMTWTPGFPTKKWGSDHIALVSELAFVKGVTDIDKDVQ